MSAKQSWKCPAWDFLSPSSSGLAQTRETHCKAFALKLPGPLPACSLGGRLASCGPTAIADLLAPCLGVASGPCSLSTSTGATSQCHTRLLHKSFSYWLVSSWFLGLKFWHLSHHLLQGPPTLAALTHHPLPY